MAIMYITDNWAKWHNPSVEQTEGWMFLIEAFTLWPTCRLPAIYPWELSRLWTQFSGQKEFTVVTFTETGSPRRRKGWSLNERFNLQRIMRLAGEEQSAKHRHIYCGIILNREELEADTSGGHRTLNKFMAHPLNKRLSSLKNSYLWWQHHNMEKCFLV